ncbi:MAG: SufS family cysteine desulfurase [Pseudomonadota bacterium]
MSEAVETTSNGDAATLRQAFPVLARTVREKPLVYLDNAATTQKPQVVIDAVRRYYEEHNANVHRAAHWLADEATRQLEAARATVAQFLNANSADRIVFTRGTTESINLVANGLQAELRGGGRILLTQLEHHANIVPWQMIAERTGAQIDVVGITAAGDLDLDDFDRKLSQETRIVSVGHISNAIGTLNPVEHIVQRARSMGARTLIDGAQATVHLPIDVQALGCDYYAFSGHKAFGPTGIGALYGTAEALEALTPMQGGGEMIERVSFNGTTYNRVPYRFEAGTPNIAGAIGLGVALEFIMTLPLESLVSAEERVLRWTLAELKQMPDIRLVGEPEHRHSVISFVASQGQPDDLGTLLDQQGVAVRTGHHCAMPLMEHWALPAGTVRASFSLYNTRADAEAFVAALRKALTFL